MEFEFDLAKSDANKIKHGIDFVEAQGLWATDAMVRTISHPGEVRFLRINRLGAKVWTVVFTLRQGRIRIISVRRARRDEEAEHERRQEEVRGDDNEH